jgi:hypothetical protein
MKMEKKKLKTWKTPSLKKYSRTQEIINGGLGAPKGENVTYKPGS